MATVEPEEVEGHFASRKKRAMKSTKVNMAEGLSTTATPSNQFVVKCSVRGHHVYKRIWSPCVGEPFEAFCEERQWTRQVCTVALHLNNCLTIDNDYIIYGLTVVGHIPREITPTCHFFIKKRKTTALHSSLWRCRSTMPGADVLPPRHQGVGES